MKEGWSNIGDLPFFKGDHWASIVWDTAENVTEKLETLSNEKERKKNLIEKKLFFFYLVTLVKFR